MVFSQRPSVHLLRLFAGRMFHGGGELGADDLELGMGVVLIFLAMPGVLVSLLMFEKFGSLIRFLRGDGVFDPYVATIPDEYFFIVLSMAVSCAAALWRWNSIFLDRRDYANLVPLPVSLNRIFFANLFAIFALTALLTIVVNAASFVLFPIAVVGSQGSFSTLFPVCVWTCHFRHFEQRIQFSGHICALGHFNGVPSLSHFSQSLRLRPFCGRALSSCSAGHKLHRIFFSLRPLRIIPSRFGGLPPFGF